MANFKLERFSRLQKNPGGIWQGGFFRMPGWVKGNDGKPYRPFIALWLDVASDQISNVRSIDSDEDPNQAALESLLEFPFENGQGPYRPAKVQVLDAKLATYLQDSLQKTDSCCDYLPELEAMQKVLQGLAEHMNGRPQPPAALEAKGITVEFMRAYADAADQFYKAKPWEELEDVDLLEIERPAPPQGFRFVSVLGYAGHTFGLGFFESIRQFEKMNAGCDPRKFFVKEGVWSLNFGPIVELPLEDADAWLDHSLPVANENAYPFAFWFGPRREMRRPDAKQLAFLEGLLRALGSATIEQLDAGRWSQQVKIFNGSVEYRLRLVDATSGKRANLSRQKLEPHNLRRAMEKGLAQIQQMADGHDFGSLEDLNAFIMQHVDIDNPAQLLPRTSLEAAQELMYQAWESRGRSRRVLARRALETCRDCADAYVLLAEESCDPQKACKIYQEGVAAGERALGSNLFENEAGNFWGILKTRPYMRARAGLAQVLCELGQLDEAVNHYQELLRLNPADNQGIRYMLAACLLELGGDKELGKLLERYDEETAQWLYLRSLLAYRKNGDSPEARKVIKKAIKSNRYMPSFLTGQRPLPPEMPDGYRLGHEDEAIFCASEMGRAWEDTPGAIEWLRKIQTLGNRTKRPFKNDREYSD